MSYFRDWFGRDADYGYTGYSSSKKYIDWDRGYDNYSDFLFSSKKTYFKDSKSKSNLDIESTSQILLTMAKVLGVKSSKFSSVKKTDKISLPTDLLKKDDITTDVFIGASLQTISETVNISVEEKAKIKLLKYGKPSIKKFVMNALNAERVNKLMAEDTPGYLKFVQKYKEYIYKSRPEVNPLESAQKRFIDLFDRIIRYPENITETEIEEFKDPIERIQKIISKAGGIPTSYNECTKLSNKISKVIQEFFESEEEKSKDSGDDESEDDDDSTGEGGSEGGGAMSEDSKEESKTKFSLSKDTEGLMKDIIESYDLDSKSTDKDLADDFLDKYKTTEESASKTITKAIFIDVPKEDRINKGYEVLKKRINLSKAGVISKLLRRKNRDYSFSIKSVRSGRLDTNKLAEAKQRVSTIYERIGSVKTDKLAVVVLVDESGSMCGSKIDKAREAAVFLAESLKNVNDVELFIYGHTADQFPHGSGSTQVYKYYEPGFTTTAGIYTMAGRHENRDGVAILSTAKRVRQLTDKNAVFIVISDGEPSAINYRGSSARTDVRRSVHMVEKMGFQVIQVTIGGYRSHDMFTNVINMDNINEFPNQFVSFLKKKINSLIKEKVTM